MTKCLTRRLVVLTVAVTVLGALVASPSSHAGEQQDQVTITLVTHDSFAVSKSVLRAFTRKTGVRVKILRAGDAGAALNQAILTKDEPLGDVFFGIDNTFLSRALDERIFEPYESTELEAVPAEYLLDPRHRVTPVDHGDVCINYDKEWFAERELDVPDTLEDLAKPEYRGLLVVENPATSSPGLAFVLATVAEFGEPGWNEYWGALRANDVEVVAGWEQAFNGSFTAGEGAGERPLVVSYASSPPAAVYFSDPRPRQSPIGTVLASCFRQIEGVGILRGTDHQRAARKLVDFMLSDQFQADLPLQMFVFPVRTGVALPKVFARFAEVPDQPLTLTSNEIGSDRERWIDEWTEAVLR